MITHGKTSQRLERLDRPNSPRTAVLPALALSTAAVSKKSHIPAAAIKIISRIRSAPDIGISGSHECGRRSHSNRDSFDPKNYQRNECNKEGQTSFQQMRRMEARNLQDEQQQSNLPILKFPVLVSLLRKQAQEGTSAAQAALIPTESHYAPIVSLHSDQQQQASKLAFSFSEPVMIFPCSGRITQGNPEETRPTAHSSGQFFHQNSENTRSQNGNSLPREILKACIVHRMKKMNDTNPSTEQLLSVKSKPCQYPQIPRSELEKQTNLLANSPASADFCTRCSAIQPIDDPLAISRNLPVQCTGAFADSGVGCVSHEEAYATSVLSEMEADLLDWVISSTLQREKPNSRQVSVKTKEMGSAGSRQATPDLRTIKQSEYQLETAKTDLENAAGHPSFASHQDVVVEPEVLTAYDLDNAMNCADSNEFQEDADWYVNVIFETFPGLRNSASNSENTSSREKFTVMTDRKKKIEGENSRPKRVKMQHISSQIMPPENATFLQSVFGYPEGVSNINIQRQQHMWE
ncbi:unnamed protein product [Gongylonema pulchrum]|uniref:POLAc domain-containing protein n=1 Tax=Gongylonema pulchrum TaxID=637853 RepID=A0A183D863_9BILA|nr:unnamed protein product [Gongylonema pulchrum]